MKYPLYKIVEILLLKNKINFDKLELKIQIESHPSYPSLHAITSVLHHFDIDNVALDISQTKEVYLQLPNHFIAQLKNEGDEYLVFATKNKKEVVISHENYKKEKLTKAIFLKDWTGIVVVVEEKDNELTNNNIDTKHTKYLVISILMGITGFLVFTNATFNFFNLIHIILSAIGIYIGVLLVKHELGIHSETVEKLCTESKKTDCDAVLNSKGATFFNLFRLSDVTFVYFTSLALAWLLFFSNNSTLNSIAILSILALPVVLYSIYYQAVVVKKWCTLCLATACVLVCQAMVSFFINPFNLPFKLNGFLLLSISFLTISIVYRNIKPLLIAKLELSKTKIEYYQFKRKFSLFNALYSNNPTLDTKINKLEEIIFGSKNAKLEILVITNPLCGFCKVIHQAVDRLLKTEDLKVIVRFNINIDNKEDASYKIATALLNLYQKDKISCKEAMHQIFTDNVDIEKWLVTYNKYTSNSKYFVLEAEKEWCLKNNIHFTPAVYLNNKAYPTEYELSDLSFFMENLIGEKGKQEKIVINNNVNPNYNVTPIIE